jgi:predicted metal-dependent hydrolase
MEQFSEVHLTLMTQGIRLFNAQKYWECHEEFEHHWLEEPGHIRNVYWAVIQVAAAMIHYRDGNLIGARGLIAKAKQKFSRCEQYKVENDLMEENLSWSALKQLVMAVPSESALEDYKNLFEFRFKDPDLWKHQKN